LDTTVSIRNQNPLFVEIAEIGREMHDHLRDSYNEVVNEAPGSDAARLVQRQHKWAGTGWSAPAEDMLAFIRLYLFSGLDQFQAATFSTMSPSVFGLDVNVRSCIEACAFAVQLGEPGLPDDTRIQRAFVHRVWARRELVNLSFDAGSPEMMKARARLGELCTHGMHLRLVDTKRAREIAGKRQSATDACEHLFNLGFADRSTVGQVMYRRFSATAHANPVVLAGLGTRRPEFDPGRAMLEFEPTERNAAFAMLAAGLSLSISIAACSSFMGTKVDSEALANCVERLDTIYKG
jgi:hypothetical protein